MQNSRLEKLEREKEKRLIKKIGFSILIGGLILGSTIYFSGRKIETGIKEGKISSSEDRVNNLEGIFKENLAFINQDSLNEEQKDNIEGISSLLEGFKGAEVSDSLLQELEVLIEKVKTYPTND